MKWRLTRPLMPYGMYIIWDVCWDIAGSSDDQGSGLINTIYIKTTHSPNGWLQMHSVLVVEECSCCANQHPAEASALIIIGGVSENAGRPVDLMLKSHFWCRFSAIKTDFSADKHSCYNGSHLYSSVPPSESCSWWQNTDLRLKSFRAGTSSHPRFCRFSPHLLFSVMVLLSSCALSFPLLSSTLINSAISAA